MKHTLSSFSLFLILQTFFLMAPKIHNREPVATNKLNPNIWGDTGPRGGRGCGRGRGRRGGRGAQRHEGREG